MTVFLENGWRYARASSDGVLRKESIPHHTVSYVKHCVQFHLYIVNFCEMPADRISSEEDKTLNEVKKTRPN